VATFTRRASYGIASACTVELGATQSDAPTEPGRHRCSRYWRGDARTLVRVDSVDSGRVSKIADLSEVSLADLAEVDNARLAKSLREVVEQVGKQAEVVAGFGSAI
jgi:FXSXX-COOH protein